MKAFNMRTSAFPLLINFLHNFWVPKCSANLTATADFTKSHCMRSLRNWLHASCHSGDTVSNNGPKVFHREMTHILSRVPGVIVDMDDILISGRSQQEHDKQLRSVLERMQEAGVTFSEKCVFSVDTIKFLGHIISQEGIKVDPAKVEAITNLPRPTNIQELRQLLGMMNHIGKFVPNLADTTKPLCDLLKKENSWTWDTQQETAFQILKKQLSTAPVLAHYSPEKETKVSADASSYGLGGVLLQKDIQDWRPVFYVSRLLTDKEQKYAQVEKEVLAVTWCCEKFSEFLIGLKMFMIETDHKPLLAFLKTKHLYELTPRIQRFRMRMMRFSYQMKHTTGKNLMSVDAPSRAPGGVPAEQDRQMEVNTDMFICSVIEGFPMTDQHLEEIRVKQAKDNICNQVMNFIKSHWPEKAKWDPALKRFWTVRDKLTVQQGLLLFQSRLVIPTELQEDILQQLHQGHQGIVKWRALAKSSVLRPGLSKQKRKFQTAVCGKERVLRPEPLQPTKTPDYLWQHIGMDLFEWKGHQYLLVVDYFSQWIEIAHLMQTTSSAVIEHVKAIFACQGIPEVIVSDNGPQFNSRVFISFSENYSFTHLTSSLLHPQGNSEAECAMQTVKKLLKKAHNPYVTLLNYCATPLQHGSRPAKLLMGRKLRTRVLTLPIQHVPDGRDMSKFQETDARLRLWQKINYDRCHKVWPLPRLTDGQPVWVKTPGDVEAVVVGPSSTASTRSYNVRMERGIQRRDRHNLRHRDQQSSSGYDGVPKWTSTTIPSQSSQQTDQCDNLSDVQPDVQPQVANDGCAQRATVYTRSGCCVKIPERLNF